MPLDAFFDPNFKYAAQSLAPSGGSVQSSNSNILLEKYGQYQAVFDSFLGSSSKKLLSSTTGMPNLKDTALAEGFDVKSSSSIRGANLALPKGHHMYGNPSTSIDANFNVLPRNSTQIHRNKKPRVAIKDDSNNLYNFIIAQQLLNSNDSVQLQRHSPLLQTFFQHNMLDNSTKPNVLNAVPKFQGGGSFPQQQQREITNHLREEASIVHPLTNGACFRRLMQFMYHVRNRPPENDLAYWREFVEEYYAPGAKKRWCFSLYENVGLQALGISPHKAMDVWHCDICWCKSGRGFEAKYEVLPRLSKLTYDNGVTDELLHVDMPRECRLPSGLMMLECGRAVQETIYEQLRVVHEGQLRLVFTQDLKLLSWEFCAKYHEVFLCRSMVAPQVVQVLAAAQKYPSAFNDKGYRGVSPKDLLANCNLIQEAGFSLATDLDLQSVAEFGFCNTYIRCLQMAEVVDTMKDLMTFCLDSHIGPIEGLKNYSGKYSTAQLTEHQRVELQDTRRLASGQDLQLLKDKLMATSYGSAPNMTCKTPKIVSQPIASTLPDCFNELTAERSLIISSVNTTKQRSRISKQKLASSNQIRSPKTSISFARTQISEQGIIRKILLEMINNSRAVKKDENEQVDYGIGRNRIVDSTAKLVGEMNMEFSHGSEDVTKFYTSPIPENLGCSAGRISQLRSASYMDSLKTHLYR